MAKRSRKIIHGALVLIASLVLAMGLAPVSASATDELPASESSTTATVTSDSFADYTVEFTFGDLQYVLPGGGSVPLADVLAVMGLEGEPEYIEVSDPTLFSASNETGEWMVTSHKAFSSDEWMHITIAGTDYMIKVTDDDGSPNYGLINGIPAADGGYVWMAMYGSDPIKWQVIGKSDANWLLISSDLIGGSSNTMNWNDALNRCVTAFSGFSSIEQAAVPVTSKSEPYDYRYESNSGYYYGSSIVYSNMFMLSSEEAETYFDSDAARQPGCWWLRSPEYGDDSIAGVVWDIGEVERVNVDNYSYFGVRPAFQLNLESILFASAAEGGKSSPVSGGGSFGTISEPSGDNEIKLTLKDEQESSARKDFSANVGGSDSAAVVPGGDLTISYSGAASEDHISALLCDSNGTILYYASTEQNSDGTWTVALPDSLAGSYKLKVFSEQQNGDRETDYASPVSAITLTAPKLYMVTFVDEDGMTVLKKATEYPFGTPAEDIEKPANPTKAADVQYTYTFAGWDPEVAEVTGDATYKATYKSTPIPAKKATLTFDLAGGTLDGKTGTITVEANVGDTIKLPSAPTRDGYTFKYWKGSEYAAGAEYKVESDHAFTAEWDKNGPAPVAAHTVTFDANGHGKAPDAQTVEEGEKAKAPANPTADGWTFGGWYKDKACKEGYDFSAPVTENITLYAKWTKDSSSGSGTSPKTGDPLAGSLASALAFAAASALALALSRRLKRR